MPPRDFAFWRNHCRGNDPKKTKNYVSYKEPENLSLGRHYRTIKLIHQPRRHKGRNEIKLIAHSVAYYWKNNSCWKHLKNAMLSSFVWQDIYYMPGLQFFLIQRKWKRRFGDHGNMRWNLFNKWGGTHNKRKIKQLPRRRQRQVKNDKIEFQVNFDLVK